MRGDTVGIPNILCTLAGAKPYPVPDPWKSIWTDSLIRLKLIEQIRRYERRVFETQRGDVGANEPRVRWCSSPVQVSFQTWVGHAVTAGGFSRRTRSTFVLPSSQ